MKESKNKENMAYDSNKVIENRLNSLYRDACEAEKQNGYGLEHSAEVIAEQLKELIQFVKENVSNELIPKINLTESPDTLGDRGYMQYVKTNIRKLADYLDIKFELDQIRDGSQTVFNLIQNQNASQYSNITFSSLINNITQLNIAPEKKAKVFKLVNEFKEEASRESPKLEKLVDLLRKITNISREAGAMISYYASIIGVYDKLLDYISSLSK